jgi:uncharacterized protein YecE (DUF72 family)
VEFRHVSWYDGNTYNLLGRYNAAAVMHDMPGSKTPRDYIPNQLAYFRFHGPTGNYNGSYSQDFIDQQAERIKVFKSQEKDIYVYFNNTMGEALENAQWLQRLVTST